MTDKKEIEVWIVMDADGDYTVGTSESDACEAFDENLGGYGPRRVVKLIAHMTPPVVEETTLDIPDTAGILKVEAAE